MSTDQLFRRWCGLSAVAVVAILFSLSFLDGPVANFTKREIHLHALSTYAPSSHLISLLLLTGAASVGLYCIFTNRFPRWAEALLLSAIGAVVSIHLAGLLKHFFGRPNPQIFVYHLRDHFGWYSQSGGMGAFPSTHAAVAAAGLSVLGLYFPRARMDCILGMLVIDVLLVIGSWHFISDVAAGNWLGFTIAALECGTVAALKARRPSGIQVT